MPEQESLVERDLHQLLPSDLSLHPWAAMLMKPARMMQRVRQTKRMVD